MKSVCWQILAFDLFYIATASILLYYRCDSTTDGRIPVEGYTWPYTIYTILYFGEKVSFLLVTWTFCHKYWIVSLTLRQALRGDAVAFSEKAQKMVYFCIAIGSVVGSAIDSALFWYEKSTGTYETIS